MAGPARLAPPDALPREMRCLSAGVCDGGQLEVEEALQRDEASLRAFLLNSTALVAHMAGVSSCVLCSPHLLAGDLVPCSCCRLVELRCQVAVVATGGGGVCGVRRVVEEPPERGCSNISLPRCSQLRRSFALAPQ
eukprot:312442-Hanusia_phi.AAC.2